ncbi:hypothetical protein [Nocardioides sp. Leaf285]|uniref:hypothetical protein n=1 Tax=Nocardioides sp. Leaf285 TaxID=1736322 RepID=UPI000A43F20A|nr:hypothetical protein [Nocardioides sp. Leaf285]
MTARTNAPRGQSSDRRWKGDRRPFISRAPLGLADKVEALAAQAGLTKSDWIILAMAEKAGYELPAGVIDVPGHDNTVQEEIAMPSAS